MTYCARCRWRPPKALGLCNTCHEYQRHTGRPRPARLIVKALKRHGY